MPHVMLDLETLGTKPGSVILSIGAVNFGPKGIGPKIYIPINQASSEASGLTTDRATLGWWLRQSPEARTVLEETRKGGVRLPDALEQFAAFMRQCGSDVRVWGCGANFDNVLLSHAYSVVGQRLPWKYTNDRCYRTLKNLFPSITIERAGTHHNAVDDALSQAEHATRIMQHIQDMQR